MTGPQFQRVSTGFWRPPFRQFWCLLVLLPALRLNAATVDSGKLWERAYGAAGLAPSADPDRDGLKNREEAAAGTDPFDPASNLSILRTLPLPHGLLLRWPAVAGRSYRIERSATLEEGNWEADEALIPGIAGEGTALIERPAGPSAYFRVRAAEGMGPVPSDPQGPVSDRDGDGKGDFEEVRAGTDPLDAGSKLAITDFRTGSGLVVEWQTQPGKVYQLQSKKAGSLANWKNEGPPQQAGGNRMRASVLNPATSLSFRLQVSDADRDGDGVTDWEEILAGLDPLKETTRLGGGTDAEALRQLLDSPVTYEVTARRPVATEGEPGWIEVRRTSGMGPIKVPLTVSGTAVAGVDFPLLPSLVRISNGGEPAGFPVTALPGSRASTVKIAVGAGNAASVALVKAAAVSVRDFGAKGDGIADDTAAIQSAIDHLESTPQHNTLHFPAGIYRMVQRSEDSRTFTGRWRHLLLGKLDLAGRDLFFTGEPGSVLFSDTGTIRTHQLVIEATFRSLTFRGLTFQKSSAPLSEVLGGASPNGADGISVIPRGLREVEALTFDRCSFINCHAALAVYNNGYDARGKLKVLNMTACQVLNPYGSNTLNSRLAWGGGQQLILTPWVGLACYENSLFEGGGEDMTDETTSPGGRLKDGCHFGCPLRLEFRNNVVKRMGVEAVFQTNDATFMGVTLDSFAIPAPGGSEVAELRMDALPSTFIAGDLVNVRTGATPTSSGNSDILTVVSFDPVDRRLRLSNNGHHANNLPGTVIEPGRPVYLNRFHDPSFAEIRDNWIDGTLPPGADPSTEPAGIVVNARSHITGNLITGHKIGILIYPEVRTLLYPASRWTIMERNEIVTRDSRDWPDSLTYGIQSWADDEVVARNTVITPASFRFVGVATRGRNSRISGNMILSHSPADHGYASPSRSIGIGIGNESTQAVAEGNTTAGFDVGVGPVNAHQDIPHRVRDHRSVGDVLPIDPRGVLPD